MNFSSSITEEENNLEDVQNIVGIIVPIFFGLIAITGLFGNSLVILVVILNPKMRSTTNLLIVNLAIADLLFVIFCIPFTATDYVLSIWPFGDFMCKIVQYLIVVTAHSSIYTLVFMSLDRFLAVVHPVTSRSYRTVPYTMVAIGILWITTLLVSLPVIFAHGLEEFDYQSTKYVSCRYSNTSLLSASTFYLIFMASSYLLPLILIIILYLRMIMRLWGSAIGAKMSTESYRGRKRCTRLVVVVVVAFASLWFPVQVILVLKSFDLYHTDTTFTILLQIVSQILAYTSSCINPLLYAFLSENFRKAFHKAINCSPKYRHYNSHMPEGILMTPTEITNT